MYISICKDLEEQKQSLFQPLCNRIAAVFANMKFVSALMLLKFWVILDKLLDDLLSLGKLNGEFQVWENLFLECKAITKSNVLRRNFLYKVKNIRMP